MPCPKDSVWGAYTFPGVFPTCAWSLHQPWVIMAQLASAADLLSYWKECFTKMTQWLLVLPQTCTGMGFVSSWVRRGWLSGPAGCLLTQRGDTGLLDTCPLWNMQERTPLNGAPASRAAEATCGVTHGIGGALLPSNSMLKRSLCRAGIRDRN